MIDNNGKIWEYNLSSGEWTARSLLGYRMNNYHMFMLNGIINHEQNKDIRRDSKKRRTLVDYWFRGV